MPDKSQRDPVEDPIEAIVVGGGPAGLTAAVALAQGGIATVLAGKRPARADNRTTALLAGSVEVLTSLGVWELCAEQTAPLATMRLIDDTGRLWRAPEVKFEAGEIDLDAFGYNIENRVLVDALERRAAALPNLRLIDDDVVAVDVASDQVTVTLKTGAPLTAPLVVGADGRRSLSREAAGIDTSERLYPQVALTVCLRHTRPHRDTSCEFHTPNGPFTLVPLPGNRSSLVWVLQPQRADELAALDDETLALDIERASHSILGKITVEPGRGQFPLSVQTARQFAANRIALVGEAAHVIPPIGAQGLNLGLRDAAAIADLASDAKAEGRDMGGDDVMTAYDRARRADINSRGFAIDILNRTLLTDFLPVQGLRGLGLYALDRIGPLRRAVMREGVSPRLTQTRRMRDAAL